MISTITMFPRTAAGWVFDLSMFAIDFCLLRTIWRSTNG